MRRLGEEPDPVAPAWATDEESADPSARPRPRRRVRAAGGGRKRAAPPPGDLDAQLAAQVEEEAAQVAAGEEQREAGQPAGPALAEFSTSSSVGTQSRCKKL